ncbi:thioredoxin family protein [Demequina sp. SO4-13]|uniref:DF family (seleno)protein n=1 Tax=Demequina sp. SO4-13 TaxID=3401027 RepID=UPI003AF79863
MRVQLLYFDGCPNWRVTEGRLREALEAVGSTANVEKVLVATPEQAEEWGFLGSPSLLIDGEDPFAQPGASVGLSCRLYRTPEGVDGSPTVGQLTEVLLGA